MFRCFLFGLFFISKLVAASTLVLPLTFEEKYNIPTVTLTLSGIPAAISFLLDTGSQEGFHLPSNLISQLPKLVMTDKVTSSIDLSGKRNDHRSFMIEQVDINGMLFKKIAGVEYKPWGFYYSSPSKKEPLNENSEQRDEHPVIGLGLFHDRILTLDYQQKNISVEDTEQTISLDDKWLSLPFLAQEEGVIIIVTDGQREYRLVLDTGASVSMIKKQALANNTKPVAHRYGLDFVAVTLKSHRASKIEAIVLDDIPDKFRADGLLGSDFLRNHAIKIDFKNKQIWLKPQ